MLRALDRAVRHSVPKPTALIVNFPSNPTAYLADLDFYREIVAFARRHEIWIMSDLAYAEIYFGDKRAALDPAGAGRQGHRGRVHRLSKTYSMPGWRMGFAAGNARLINALTRMKSYLDYGAFTPIQVAATAALNGPQDCVAEMRALYRERRDVLIRGLRAAGWDVPSPDGSMFAWAPIPPRFAHSAAWSSPSCCWRAPRWRSRPASASASTARAIVRIALVENTHRLRQAVRNIRALPRTPTTQARPSRRWPRSHAMTRPLSVALAGLGTVGGGVLDAAARQRRHRRRARRAADRRHRRLRARPHARPRHFARRACAGTTTRWRSPPIPRSTSWSS